MIDQDFEEGNKIIAQFMGGKFVVWGEDRPCEWFFRHRRICDLWYHTRWEEIMPVVEKIANTPMEDFINEETEDGGYAYPITFGMRNDNGQWMVRFRGHGLHYGDTLLEAAWEACFDFIKSQNQPS